MSHSVDELVCPKSLGKYGICCIGIYANCFLVCAGRERERESERGGARTVTLHAPNLSAYLLTYLHIDGLKNLF